MRLRTVLLIACTLRFMGAAIGLAIGGAAGLGAFSLAVVIAGYLLASVVAAQLVEYLLRCTLCRADSETRRAYWDWILGGHTPHSRAILRSLLLARPMNDHEFGFLRELLDRPEAREWAAKVVRTSAHDLADALLPKTDSAGS